MAPATQVRSPTAGYAAYAPYPQQQYTFPHGATAPDPRSLPPPIPSMHPYDTASALGHRRNSLVERTSMRPGGHGSTPYPRVPSVATHAPEPPVEPVKKKRKRADAEQLKVLNETYNRTAFPSTEERIELAKKLGMSARSVQIWCVPRPVLLRVYPTNGSSHYGVAVGLTGSRISGKRCVRAPARPRPARPQRQASHMLRRRTPHPQLQRPRSRRQEGIQGTRPQP